MTTHIAARIARRFEPGAQRRSDAEFDRRIERLFDSAPSSGRRPDVGAYPSPSTELRAALVPLTTAVIVSAVLVLGIAVTGVGA